MRTEFQNVFETNIPQNKCPLRAKRKCILALTRVKDTYQYEKKKNNESIEAFKNTCANEKCH